MPRDEIDQRTGTKPWDDNVHFTQCQTCGALIDFRNLRQVIAHSGLLPHPPEDRREPSVRHAAQAPTTRRS